MACTGTRALVSKGAVRASEDAGASEDVGASEDEGAIEALTT